MTKHIIFDLDGTLINSFPVMEKAWNKVIKKFNLNIPFNEYKKFTGLPFDKIMEKFNLSKITKEIKSFYFSETKKRANQITLINGAKKLITILKNKGYKISIITSKPRKSFNSLKKLLPKNIDLILCSDDTNFEKPDKRLINVYLKKCNVKINQLVFIGDTIFDYQFSVNSKINFIFFSNNGQNKLPKNLVNKIKSVDKLLEVRFLL